jgi:DNA-directed RNA polymerase specialized sigma subunit
MIKNERQYRITRTQAEQFAHALAEFRATPPDPQVHPLLRKAEEDGLQSMLNDLQTQLAEYEALRAGERLTMELESLDQLPRALIQARIAADLSQKELAERLGLKEQQIQRYEATDYEAASLERIGAIMHALGLRVCAEVFLPVPHVQM